MLRHYFSGKFYVSLSLGVDIDGKGKNLGFSLR